MKLLEAILGVPFKRHGKALPPTPARPTYHNRLSLHLRLHADLRLTLERVIMASRIAKEWLASQGVVINGHNATECSNFATGTGFGKLASPYHIVAVDSRYGTSKRTVDWARTEQDANDKVNRLTTAQYERVSQGETSTGRGGGEYHNGTTYYYWIDVRNNEQGLDMSRLGFGKKKV